MPEKNKSKAKGGLARAAALTPERKREIASSGAAARWGNLPKAIRTGNFQEEFGIDVDCYVLDDAAKTAVISQRGMGLAIGLSPRGNALPRFLTSKAMAKAAGAGLAEKLSKPLKFQWSVGGAEGRLQTTVFGFDVTLLIDVCKAVIEAEDAGTLTAHQKHIAKQARIILNASAKAGIKELVYALAGYDATREETIAAFKLYIREEAREYEREFPPQLYEEWYRLYDLPKPEKNRPWKFKQLTVEHVYKPLARSNGKVFKLIVDQRSNSNKSGRKLHQFLSEIGVKTLRTHLGQLLGIAQVSSGQSQYESHVERIFGVQQQFDLPEGI